MNALQAFWLAYLSQPSSDRAIYRAIRRRKIRRILEVGLGDARRAVAMARLAGRYHPANEIRYVGIDRFEDTRPGDGPSISLKQAYRQLRATGVRTHLVPGDLLEALARAANPLPGNELAIISAEAAGSFESACFYLPRMLATGALVLLGGPGQTAKEGTIWRTVRLEEIEKLAPAARPRRLAA